MSVDLLDSLVQSALKQGELRELLLGRPSYEFLPKFSPSPWQTDHATILTRLAAQCGDPEVSQRVAKAVTELAGTYEGVVPAAMCYLHDVISLRRGGPKLGLDLDELGPMIAASVQRYESELRLDREGPGATWPEGLYGELRHLNKLCLELGGPGFRQG